MITLPSTAIALRLAVIGAAIAAAASVELYLEQRADERATRVDQAFVAALWIPTSGALDAAMRPVRSDRGAVSDLRRNVRSVTVEQRRGDASSDLVRIQTTELAQR